MNLRRHRPSPLPLLFFGVNAGTCLLLLLAIVLAGCAAGPIPEGKMPTPKAITPTTVAASASEGSLYTPNRGLSLFEDTKARNTGDLVTVLLIERTQASKSATTSTSKNTGVEVGDVRVFGQGLNVGTEISGGSTFDGSGASAQSNQLQGSLTVTVVERLNNGVLRIAGEKRLRLNQGDETVKLEGLIRTADITPANTITSDRIAEARLIYQGKGALADANAKGWLARFFDSPWMPF